MNALNELIGGWLHDAALTALFFDAWVKSLALLAVAGGLCLCCRRAAAATRHWIWFLALASLPCLLVLSAVPHAWQRPLWSVSTGFNSGNEFSLTFNLAPAREAPELAPAIPPGGTAPASTGEVRAGNRQPIVAHFSATLLVLGILVWLVGIVVGLLSVLAGQLRLRRLARSSLPVQVGTRSTASRSLANISGTRWNASLPAEVAHGCGAPEQLRNGLPTQATDWALLLREACDQLRLRRPVRLLQSADNPMPLTWGWWRPVVLLPADAAHWPAERCRVVLLHELAHAQRWDCLTQTVARMVCALYWINPLVWLAARRMRIERERACDDLVLNSGCRASDYATHLVDIARTFRRSPQFAGIAMARSSQLQGRIAAIVDASRARQLRPFTALASLVLMSAVALSVGGSSPDSSRKPAEDSTLRQQQLAQLEAFARAKEKQAEELAAKAGKKITPEFKRFFDAAIKGDGRTVTNRFWYFRAHHGQYEHKGHVTIPWLWTAYWQPVLELCLAYNQFQDCDPKYTALYADGIIDSIPAGSIYFGGTDPGRGVPTAFCKSHADADPFFTVTQNALADGSYMQYLRAMYGGKIYIPTTEDAEGCFAEYKTDAQRRMQEHKLEPGEDVKMVDGKVKVHGQVAVMRINGLLTKVIFDHNPDRKFYVEESFPLDWMYPHLEPHGLIMKLNRQPLAQLPEEVLARDREYWRKVVAGMIGDWLGEQTTVREVAAFVDQVYVHKNLKGFTGDPQFVHNHCAKASFSKLRSSIGGLYVWRLGPNAPPAYRAKSDADYQRLRKEADLSFRQAFALCPDSPEALFRYVQLLLQLNRMDDALLIAETFLKVDPQNQQARGLLENVKSYKRQQGHVGEATNNLSLGVALDKKGQTDEAIRQLQEAVRLKPDDGDAHYNLGVALSQKVQTEEAILQLQEALRHARRSTPEEIRQSQEALRLKPGYAEARNYLGTAFYQQGRLDEAIRQYQEAIRLKPDDAEAHNNLGTALGMKGQIDEAVRQFQEALRMKPGYAGAHNSLGTSLGKPAQTSTLTGAQVEALAVQLANEKAQALYNCQPFREGTPADLVQGHWVWNDLRAYRSLDVEATVKFGADGTIPEVNVILLDGRPNPRLR